MKVLVSAVATVVLPLVLQEEEQVWLTQVVLQELELELVQQPVQAVVVLLPLEEACVL